MSLRTSDSGPSPIALFGLLLGLCQVGCPAPSGHAQGAGQVSRAAAPSSDGAGARPGCQQPKFQATPEGVTVLVGNQRYRFVAHEVLGEHAYNYTRRTVALRLADGKGLPSKTGKISIEASCYTETDCTAPKDPGGKDLWCLVSHTSLTNPFYPLYQRHRLCPTPLDFIEQLVTYAPSPACFRTALTTYPEHASEILAELDYDLERDDSDDHDELRSLIKTCYALIDAAEKAKHDDPKKAVAKLEATRRLLRPHLSVEQVWIADATLEQALAGLTHRYPYTLVGPKNTIYDVLEGADLISGSFEKTVRPVAPPWDGSRTSGTSVGD